MSAKAMNGEQRSLLRIAEGLRTQARQLLNQADAIEAAINPYPTSAGKTQMFILDPRTGEKRVIQDKARGRR